MFIAKRAMLPQIMERHALPHPAKRVSAPLIALATGLAFSALPRPALAEETPESLELRRADTSFTVGDILVTARAAAGSSATRLTSVDRMGGDVAQNANVDHIFDLVGQMPGIQITDFNQGTTSGKFSLRGFNGEGNINAVKLLIDGIPANSNDGNMPYLDMLFPLNIETIEVVRGTADPRYGLHAIAGSANIITRAGGTYLDARGSAGSYATYEGQVVAGLDTGNIAQNYHVAYRRGSGYRDHSAMDRLGLSGRWQLALGGAVRLGVLARYAKAKAQEPGYLTLVDSRSNPHMTNKYNASDGDVRIVQQYAMTADMSLSDRLTWSGRAYVNRLRDDRYVKFSAGASQQRRLTQEDHYGASGALHWQGAVAGMGLTLEAGGDIEWQDNRSLRWLSADRVLTSQTRDQQFNLSVGGVYAEAIWEPAPWLRVTPAYRVDWVGGDFTNRLNASTAPINAYGAIRQPKASIALMPIPGLTLYGNWGKSFQIGLGSGAYLIPPRVANLSPSINTGWEGGAKVQLAGAIEARIAYWAQSATGEIARKLNDPLGDFENVGATSRRGADVEARVQPVPGVELWGALSWQQAKIMVPAPATPQYAGNRIDHTPEWLLSGGLNWTPAEAVTVSFSGRGQSSYFLTSANAEGTWGAMTSFDASVSYRLDKAAELGLSIKNLTNNAYEYVWWDGAQTLHSPSDGRNVTASLRLRF